MTKKQKQQRRRQQQKLHPSHKQMNVPNKRQHGHMYFGCFCFLKIKEKYFKIHPQALT